MEVLAAEAQPARQGFPIWLLALIPAGVLFLGCIGGIGFLAYFNATQGDGDKQKKASQPPQSVADGASQRAAPAGQPADSPPRTRPENSIRPPENPSRPRTATPDAKPADKPSEPAALEADFASVDLKAIYSAYEGNEAAADAEYLNKRVQFSFGPQSIDKDKDGRYFAWDNIFGLPDPVKYGQHYKCYFRADQVAALAEFKPGMTLTVRGVCAGKTGMFNFYYAGMGTRSSPAGGFWKASPMIAFKDCELVGKPADARAQEAEETRRRAQKQANEELKRRNEETKAKAEDAKRQAQEDRMVADDSKARVLVRQGQSLADRGFANEAQKRYQEVIDKYPDTPSASRARDLLRKMSGLPPADVDEKPEERPPAKSDRKREDKPADGVLKLEEVVRDDYQRGQEYTKAYNDSIGKDNKVAFLRLKEKLQREEAALLERPVAGVAVVNRVQLSSGGSAGPNRARGILYLEIPMIAPGYIISFHFATTLDDPLLDKFVKGQELEVRGKISVLNGHTLSLQDCTVKAK